jgi:serine/threonine-protein kinase
VSSDRDTVTAQTALTEVAAGRGGPARDSVILGKYRVENTLGFGGMGIVLRAHNIQLDEPVAIKIPRDDVSLDGDAVERFLREAKAAVRLKSEHVAKIRDVGTLENGRPYMVMELLEGVDLGKLLVDVGQIESTHAVELLLQTCDAMAEAHANGIVHRDIKPTNLFLAKRRDGSDLLKVLDFGISKAQSGPEMSLTQTSSMLGTPAYMSPEQMRSARTVDPRSDIWALGTVLYELVEGRPPFAAQNFAELCVMVSTEPHAPMTLAPHLAAIIDRCLEKAVDRRYQNVAELASDLESFSEDPVQAHRLVKRIARVLGTPIPSARDSTPIPMDRPGMPRLPTTPSVITSNAAAAPALSAVHAVPRRTSAVKTVLVLALLFGIGIAGGLYVTQQDEPVAATTPPEPAAPVPATAPVDAGAPPDNAAVVDDARPIDDAAPTADSGIEVTIKKPPRNRPPPHRPAVKPPVKPPVKPTVTPETATVPPPPPVKKCDPFDNPKGCK